ncbi:MAG: transcriptional repressor LexA [Gammaproteobacteria bacterium]|nr:MAG: transcriptional repressor LexA [Gammaproteobacteria bacterium]
MLTDRQRQVLEFIGNYFAQHGYAPKLVEIANALQIRSRGVVHRYIQALVNEGYLEHFPGKSRGLKLTEQFARIGRQGSIPLIGRIAAGSPIEAIPDQEFLDIGVMFNGPDLYSLEVRGDSMINMGIMDGDIVIIKKADSAQEGQVVVALIDGSAATLKRLHYRQDGQIELRAENDNVPNQIYSPDRVQIQGILSGQIRTY